MVLSQYSKVGQFCCKNARNGPINGFMEFIKTILLRFDFKYGENLDASHEIMKITCYTNNRNFQFNRNPTRRAAFHSKM